MKRTITCKLSGSNVVQTTTIQNDDGSLLRENTVTLGDQGTVLDHLNQEVSKAASDLSGATSPLTSKPAAADGTPGETIQFYLDGKTLTKVTTLCDGNGKLRSQRVEPLGGQAQILANYQERLAELTTTRDAVSGAK